MSDYGTVANIITITEVIDDRSFSWKINPTDRIPEGHLYITTRVHTAEAVNIFPDLPGKTLLLLIPQTNKGPAFSILALHF